MATGSNLRDALFDHSNVGHRRRPLSGFGGLHFSVDQNQTSLTNRQYSGALPSSPFMPSTSGQVPRAAYAAYEAIWKSLLFDPEAASGYVLNKTLDAATASSAATVRVSAALSGTLGAATSSSAAAVLVSGALSRTLGAATLSGAATVTVTASLSATLGAATLSAAGTVSTAGWQLSATLGAATLSSAGSLPVAGSLAATLGSVTLTSAAAAPIAGSLAATLGAATLAAAGSVPVAAQLGSTLGAATLSGTLQFVSGAITASADIQLAPATLEARIGDAAPQVILGGGSARVTDRDRRRMREWLDRQDPRSARVSATLGAASATGEISAVPLPPPLRAAAVSVTLGVSRASGEVRVDWSAVIEDDEEMLWAA